MPLLRFNKSIPTISLVIFALTRSKVLVVLLLYFKQISHLEHIFVLSSLFLSNNTYFLNSYIKHYIPYALMIYEPDVKNKPDVLFEYKGRTFYIDVTGKNTMNKLEKYSI